MVPAPLVLQPAPKRGPAAAAAAATAGSSAAAARRKGPPNGLRIDTPVQNPAIVVAFGPASTSSLSSATSEFSAADALPFANPLAKPRSLRNMKKLSLALPSAGSSTHSLALPTASSAVSSAISPVSTRSRAGSVSGSRSRAGSVSSMTASTVTAALAHRKEEEGGSPSIPYSEGPVEILPGLWLGSEDNARDTEGLEERGIRAILNVAKEVVLPSEPGIAYLKMQWSHGQTNLLKEGFPPAMAFVDAARERNDGVLVHCQCGISRSGTMMIALVMRAAAASDARVPAEVWELKGMNAAYAYVKQKSRWVGPNMYLLYQLLDYERALSAENGSPVSDRSSNVAEDEAEWSRRRAALDEQSDDEEDARQSLAFRREAEALDRAMEDRKAWRQGTAGAGASAATAPAWRTRFPAPPPRPTRRRAGSKASLSSIRTASSVISEDLLEEDEEEELLGIGTASDGRSMGTSSRSPSLGEHEDGGAAAPDGVASPFTPQTARPRAVPLLVVPPSAPPTKTGFGLPPPSAPHTKTRFGLPPPSAPAFKASFALGPPPPKAAKPSSSSFALGPPPRSAFKTSFGFDAEPPAAAAQPLAKGKRRPSPLVSVLPPVPSSPDVLPPAVALNGHSSESESDCETSYATVPAPAPAPVLALPLRAAPKNTAAALLPPATAPLPAPSAASPPKVGAVPLRLRKRTQSTRPTPPPLHLRSSNLSLASASSSTSSRPSSTSSSRRSSQLAVPSTSGPTQTLFVFPPSPPHPNTPAANSSALRTARSRTPATMTLMSNLQGTPYGGGAAVPFPCVSPPRVSRMSHQGRTRSFVSIAHAATPTTACSRVDASGWFGEGP